MEFNWSSMSNEELNTALAAIRTELTERDKAKAQKLVNAIDKAIRNFRAEYPTACWMIEIDDDDGFPREINLFNYDFDTTTIIP